MKDFEEIYRTYYQTIYRYLLSLTQNENLAEELTQETFFKVIQKIDSYRGECRLSSWMCQIAKNTFFSYIKKAKHHQDFPIDTLPADQCFEKSLEDKEMVLKIHKVLHTLEEPYKEVFRMRIFGELSFAEIGKVQGKSENWARVTYYRAKLKIKEALE